MVRNMWREVMSLAKRFVEATEDNARANRAISRAFVERWHFDRDNAAAWLAARDTEAKASREIAELQRDMVRMLRDRDQSAPEQPAETFTAAPGNQP